MNKKLLIFQYLHFSKKCCPESLANSSLSEVIPSERTGTWNWPVLQPLLLWLQKPPKTV